MSADPATIALDSPRPRTRNRFYLGMTLLLAGIVFAGFTPTLFGRAAFNVPKMPAYLYLHGLAIAGWYALLVAQATLVGTGRFLTHQRLGWFSLTFLILVPFAGLGTQLALPHRLQALGALEALRPLVETIFWLNLFSAAQFVLFVFLALLRRKQGEYHKRLMLLASIAIIGPAAARLSRWPVFGNSASDLSQPSSSGNDVTFAVGALLLLLAALVINDLRTRRRLHPATVMGAVVLVGMGLLTPVIANSEWGKAIVWSLY